jgi:hypothetical protein
MRKQSVVFANTMVLVLALATVSIAADPFVGTWKLDVGSCTSQNPPPKSQIINIESQENGLKFVTDTVTADGKAIHGEFMRVFDGKDYLVGAEFDDFTVAFTRIDANTIEAVNKLSGKEISRWKDVVSDDGKRMTRIGKDKIIDVCDKQ